MFTTQEIIYVDAHFYDPDVKMMVDKLKKVETDVWCDLNGKPINIKDILKWEAPYHILQSEAVRFEFKLLPDPYYVWTDDNENLLGEQIQEIGWHEFINPDLEKIILIAKHWLEEQHLDTLNMASFYLLYEVTQSVYGEDKDVDTEWELLGSLDPSKLKDILITLPEREPQPEEPSITPEE